MQSAPVAPETNLAYIDSGPPIGDTYTTLVLVHGHSYSALNFSRVLERSPKHNIRVIALNRRDYIGSTLFTSDELALLHSNDEEKHKQFFHDRGLEIARFLVWVIDELKIPEGRLALAGWSLGTITTLAFLRHLPSYPEDVIRKLTPYLKTFFIYESACAIIGYEYPEAGYHPLQDADIPASERAKAFTAWLASYFSHPVNDVPLSENQTEHTLSQLALRAPLPTELTAEYKRPSHENILPEAFAASVDPVPGGRSENAFYGTLRTSTLYDQLSGALCLGSAPESNDSTQSGTIAQAPVLPDLRVIEIYCTRSMWTVQWGVWKLEEDLKRRGARRPVGFARVEGGNHFWHWDDPDAFLQLMAEKCGVAV